MTKGKSTIPPTKRRTIVKNAGESDFVAMLVAGKLPDQMRLAMINKIKRKIRDDFNRTVASKNDVFSSYADGIHLGNWK
jgi:hypothetical protein